MVEDAAPLYLADPYDVKPGFGSPLGRKRISHTGSEELERFTHSSKSTNVEAFDEGEPPKSISSDTSKEDQEERGGALQSIAQRRSSMRRESQMAEDDVEFEIAH